MNEMLEPKVEELKPEKKSAQEYYKMYLEAKELDSSRFDDYTELLAYYEMQEASLPKNRTVKPWVININTPYAADAINIRAASFFSKDYMGELEPLSPDDVEKIDTLNNVYHNFWKEMNLDNHVNEAISNCLVLREAYTHIIFEDKIVGGTNMAREGKLTAYSIDPASVLIDPEALDFKDAEYIIVVDRISQKEAERKYGMDEDTGIDAASGFQPSERGEIYAGKDYDTNQHTIKTRLTFYEKTNKNLIHKTVLVERKIVDNKYLPISVFPIAQLRYEKRKKSPYGISLMDRLLPLQKSINAIESATTTAALAFASPSYAVRRDSGVDPRAVAALAGSPGVVFTVIGDPETAIKPISNGKIDDNLVAIKQENRSELYKIAGISEEFLGNFGTSGNTAGGTEKASNRAQIVEHKFFDNLEQYIEDLTHIIVEFVTKGFKGETIYSRGEKKTDGAYDFKQFDITEEMQDVQFNFSINMDIKTPYAKENTKALLTELYQMERQYDAPIKAINVLDILKNYNLPNEQELVKRYSDMVSKDEQTKAAAITEWVNLCMQNGIDAATLNQGIIELMNGKEIPTVEQTINAIEQMKAQQQQQEVAIQQQLAAKAAQLAEQQMMEQYKMQQQPLTGDEVMGAQDIGGGQLTGDEIIGM